MLKIFCVTYEETRKHVIFDEYLAIPTWSSKTCCHCWKSTPMMLSYLMPFSGWRFLWLMVCPLAKISISRLVVNLTQPASSCFGKHLPKDLISTNYYLQICGHLREYKRVCIIVKDIPISNAIVFFLFSAFSDSKLFEIFTKKITRFLDLVWLK